LARTGARAANSLTAICPTSPASRGMRHRRRFASGSPPLLATLLEPRNEKKLSPARGGCR
jgi:hypothetical protein